MDLFDVLHNRFWISSNKSTPIIRLATFSADQESLTSFLTSFRGRGPTKPCHGWLIWWRTVKEASLCFQFNVSVSSCSMMLLQSKMLNRNMSRSKFQRRSLKIFSQTMTPQQKILTVQHKIYSPPLYNRFFS